MGEEKLLEAEKRKFPRLTDNIFIRGNLNSNPVTEFKAFTENMGVGGLMFETEREIARDNELELEIYQPVNLHKNIIFSISLLAKVVWIKEFNKENFEPGENKYRIGMEFTEIKEEDRKRIIKHLERMTLVP
ncbi:MAG: PilZ domain-containing protein [Elusimicrobia bacterium]|nr:PilZ domain-containing protein [Elusimicrobiota bacterium]